LFAWIASAVLYIKQIGKDSKKSSPQKQLRSDKTRQATEDKEKDYKNTQGQWKIGASVTKKTKGSPVLQKESKDVSRTGQIARFQEAIQDSNVS
jgi:hypothetical protein